MQLVGKAIHKSNHHLRRQGFDKVDPYYQMLLTGATHYINMECHSYILDLSIAHGCLVFIEEEWRR